MAFLLITDKVAQVLATVAIGELSVAVHLVLQEAAHVTTAVRPGIGAPALHHIQLELALVARTVKHDKLALPVPVAVPVLALEAPVVPAFHPVAILFIAGPLAVVRRFVPPKQLALSASLVIFEVSNIVAAIWINNATQAVVLTRGPVAIVSGAIWPDLVTSSVTLGAAPLANILDQDVVNVAHFRFSA